MKAQKHALYLISYDLCIVVRMKRIYTGRAVMEEDPPVNNVMSSRRTISFWRPNLPYPSRADALLIGAIITDVFESETGMQ